MSILDNAKDIADLIKKYNDQDLYERIVNLRDEIFQLKDENRKLKEGLFDLKQQLVDKGSLVWESPYYWKMVDGEKDGPYCQHCKDAENKFIRLQKRGKGMWRCQACKSAYADKNYVPPQPKPRISRFQY